MEIVNINNPDWKIRINGASSRKLVDIKIGRDAVDWERINATETEFTGYGGAGNLKEILKFAVEWFG